MRWLFGIPPRCQRLGGFTYRHRGQVVFQIERHGMTWFCHDGYKTPLTLSDRKTNRDWGWDANQPLMCSMMREDGWGSFSRNALLRKVCRAIDDDIAKAMRDDIRYLEAKGIRGLSV